MTVVEKVEQSVTHRPDSYVPGRTLLAMTGRPQPTTADRSSVTTPCTGARARSWVRCAARGPLSGSRGPRADLAHTVVRLVFDQTAENVTGAGAPPNTWPVSERAVDVLAKGPYSFVTGAVADRLIDARQEPRRGRTSH